MKKLLYLIVIAAFALLSSCNENEKTDDVFSTKTPEQKKADLEQSGLNMVNELKKIETEPAYEANSAFASFLTTSGFFKNKFKTNTPQNQIGFVAVYALRDYKTKGPESVFKNIKTAIMEEPETLEDEFNELVGIYNWDIDTKDWVYTKTGDKIIFNFPSTDDGTINNASYSIFYQSYFIDFDDQKIEYPKNLSSSLVVDNTTIQSLTFESQVDNNNIPSNLSLTLTLGSFSFNVQATNNFSTFEGQYSLTNDENVLVKIIVGAQGKWDFDYAEQKYENKEITDIVETANVYAQFIDIKLVGNADINAMDYKINELMNRDIDNIDEEEAAFKELAEIVNKNTSLSVRYVSTNQIIAKVILDYTIETDEWDNTQWVQPQLFMVFDEDGSKQSLEYYFETGFEDFINEVENWIDELRVRYGEIL